MREIEFSMPGAAITALTHCGHAAALREAGVSNLIEVPGRRFGVLRTPLTTLRRLRTTCYDQVVIPQMAGGEFGHANLYLLALAIGASSIATFDPDNGLQWHSRRALLIKALRAIAFRSGMDIPLALCLMALACVWPRSSRRSRPPRVLHVITSWGVGGAQRQLAEFVKMAPPEIPMDVFVLSRGDGEFSDQHLEGHPVRITYSRRWPLLTATIIELAMRCRREHYSVVHTWLFFANALGVAGARLGGTPCVISSVRNMSLWKRTWARQWWFRAADVLSGRASDLVTVNADSMRRDHGGWALLNPRRIVVVPNGLDPRGLTIDSGAARTALRTRLSLSPDIRLVGTVGRMAREKDHELLLDAWRQVTRVRADVRLVIAGNGELRPILEARIRDEGLSVTLLDEHHARETIAGLDLFVLPSRIEGFANVLLEAAMLGVPSIATEVGAAREVLGADEDLVPVGDAACLAGRILDHLNDLTGAVERARARRAFVREAFSVDRMVQHWLALYNSRDRQQVALGASRGALAPAADAPSGAVMAARLSMPQD